MNKGSKHTKWAKDRISRMNTGRKHSAETKNQMSKARMGMKFSPAHKESQRKSALRRWRRYRWSQRLNSLNFLRGLR